MANVMVMSAAQAAQVTQKVSPYAAIKPVPMTDGRFYVGVEVVNDPAFAQWHTQLAAFAAANSVPFASISAFLPKVGPPH